MRERVNRIMNTIIFIGIENKAFFDRAIGELGKEIIQLEDIAEHTVNDAALYITDNASIAGRIAKAGGAVLAYCHQGGDKAFPGIKYVVEDCERLEEGCELTGDYLERVFRRYRGLPWTILETDRCILRETTVEDVDSFFEIYNDPEITKFTEGLYPTPADEKAYTREYIKKVYEYFEFGVWTVLLKETGEIIGRAGLSVREACDYPELGFVIGKNWQGKGVAFEVCEAILEYGKNEFEFDTFQAVVRNENIPSINLLRKLGFERRDEIIIDEIVHDLYILD